MEPWEDRWADQEAGEAYFFETTMNKHRQEAKSRLLSAITREYEDEIVSILARAYHSEDEAAIKLAKHLDLNQLHFDALLEHEQEFKLNYYNRI